MKKNYFFLTLFGLLLSTSLSLAQGTVSGKVIESSSGEGLPGVNVVIKGTSTGTLTDIDGNFSVDVGQGDYLIFSYVGYRSQEVEVGSTTSFNITLEEDFTSLEEVVVTGLASTVKRSNLANSVTTVSSDQLTGTTKAQSVNQALFGKIAGANIKISSGAPGGGTSVQLRGLSTIGNGNSQPLYIIDGVYVNNNAVTTGISSVNQAGAGTGRGLQDDIANRLADINPDDIASIEVLKGPSAAAIYGTRANAGVIIINTKRGKSGETKIRLTQEFGYNQALNLIGSASWDQAKIDNSFGGSALRTSLFATGRNIDWEEEVYGEEGFITNTAVTVSGGSEKTKFFISAGTRDEDGIIKRTGFARNSIRANIDHKFNDFIDISTQSNYINSVSDRGFTGNQNNTGASLGYTLAFAPPFADFFPVDGIYPDNPLFSENPIALRDLATNRNTVNRFIQSFSVNFRLLQNESSFLKFSVQGGIDYTSGSSIVHLPETLQFQRNSQNPGEIVQGRNNQLNTNLQFFLNYNKTLGDFNFSTSLGIVKLVQESEEVLIRGQGLNGGVQRATSAQVQSVLREFNTRAVDFGYVAQEEINYRDQIILTGGVRFDRSTLNLDQDEFFAFPKASAAINIHNFDFYNFNPISQLKVRVAYGETGGLPSFGRTFTALNTNFIGSSAGLALSTLTVQEGLQPETAQELEFGVDLGFLDGRIGLEATYYIKTVEDLIESFVPAGSTGITSILQNVGDLENKGLELSLKGSPVKNENFVWNAFVNFWTLETELTRFDVPSFTRGGFGAGLGTYEFAEGQSPTTIVGTPALTDADGNATGRFTVYGDAQPSYQFSFGSDFTISKNLNVSFLFHRTHGNDIINLTGFLQDLAGTTADWDDDDDGDGVPNGEDRAADASRFVEDGSFWKLRELGIHYTLPKNMVDNLFKGVVKGVKVGASGNNLFVWTDYSSYDPEVSQFSQDAVASSVEVTPFPSSRRVMFHINLDF